MKVVHGGDLNFEHRKDKRAGRGGTGHKSLVLMNDELLGRDPNRADNFYVGVSVAAEGEFSTPRHRHNFDQWRFMVDGCSDFTTAKLTSGALGYYPEGAYYGPQESVSGTVIIVQFGGPSGSGYVSRGQMVAVHAAMQARNTGVFENGLYRRNPGVEGKPVQDAYEAQWEFLRERPLEYPNPQYPEPVLIDTNAFPWAPIDEQSGVSEKALGTFTSCRFGAARYKLSPGASLSVASRGIYIVLSGRGEVEGEPFKQYTALYLEDGEHGAFSAEAESEVLFLGLPSLSKMQQPAPAPAALQAAE